jgi:D-alanine--poly(phosphoribitol) ligase subunit 1
MSDLVQETVDLVDAFLSKVLSHPHLPAVEYNGMSTSYAELGALAKRIAGSVHQVASTPSPRVLLALPPSTSAYAGMIGTLIAGGTFCPVNIEGPENRNAIITRAFSPDVILFDDTPSSFLDDLPATTPRIDVSRLGTHSLDRPTTVYSEVAYVVFTSGSSGQPKGVKIGRTGFSHFLTIARSYFNLTPGERWGQFSNLGYDLAVMDVFLAITQGGALVPLASPKEQRFPVMAIKERRIAIWQSVPSVLELMFRAHQVSSDYLAPLRVMSFCGEPLLPGHLNALFSVRPDLQVFNTYGTTETTGFNTINHLTSDNYQDSCEAPTVALGDEVPGWTLSLRGGDSVDEGEIVVSSDCLSLGYWHDEDRTRHAFRQLRLEGAQERRSYFTGDWGIRKNSRLYFSCRIDRQVKIRGERIELDEIDYFLREAGFAAAYTVLKGDALHSFVESVDNVDEERVRAYLAKRLPFHSVPKTVRALPSLPRNPNGKIDRGALEE